MGVDISSIVPKKEISLDDLSGKIIVVDAFNTLYQFLTTIRQPDGTPLMDRRGNITSHLSGLYYRTLNLLAKGIRPIFVFDGKSPEQKYAEKEKREAAKKEAELKYAKAMEAGEIEEAAKMAKRTAKLTSDMVNDAKKLLDAMGLPYVQAPSEGEAQAAFMAKRDPNIYAVASQDYDALLYGAPRLVQNLTLAKKRKTRGGVVAISPMLIELQSVLNFLQIDLDRLICLGIIVGTDFNNGVRGLGPKKALKIVQGFKAPYEIFKYIEKSYDVDFDWKEIFELFKRPEVKKNFSYDFKPLDKEKIVELLCHEHDFSEERVLNALEKLEEGEEEGSEEGEKREKARGKKEQAREKSQESLSKWIT
jgi:flap endonuclease-1